MLCTYRSKKYTQQKRPRTAAPNSTDAGNAHGVLTGYSGYSRGTHGDSRGTHRYSQGTHGALTGGTAKNCGQQGVQPTPRRTAAVGGPVPADRSALSLNQLRDRRRGRCCVRVRVDIVRWSRSRLQCPRAFPGPRACDLAGRSAAGGAAARRSRVAPKSAHRRLGFESRLRLYSESTVPLPQCQCASGRGCANTQLAATCTPGGPGPPCSLAKPRPGASCRVATLRCLCNRARVVASWEWQCRAFQARGCHRQWPRRRPSNARQVQVGILETLESAATRRCKVTLAYLGRPCSPVSPPCRGGDVTRGLGWAALAGSGVSCGGPGQPRPAAMADPIAGVR